MTDLVVSASKNKKLTKADKDREKALLRQQEQDQLSVDLKSEAQNLAAQSKSAKSSEEILLLIDKALQMEDETLADESLSLLTIEDKMIANLVTEAKFYLKDKQEQNRNTVKRLSTLAGDLQQTVNSWYEKDKKRDASLASQVRSARQIIEDTLGDDSYLFLDDNDPND